MLLTTYHLSTRVSMPRTKIRSPTTKLWNTFVSISYVVPVNATVRISASVCEIRYMFQSLFVSLATHINWPTPAVLMTAFNESKSSQLNSLYSASVNIGSPAVLTVKSNPSADDCVKNKSLSYVLVVLKMSPGYTFSASTVGMSPEFLNASNTGLEVIVPSSNCVSMNAVLSVAPYAPTRIAHSSNKLMSESSLRKRARVIALAASTVPFFCSMP